MSLNIAIEAMHEYDLYKYTCSDLIKDACIHDKIFGICNDILNILKESVSDNESFKKACEFNPYAMKSNNSSILSEYCVSYDDDSLKIKIMEFDKSAYFINEMKSDDVLSLVAVDGIMGTIITEVNKLMNFGKCINIDNSVVLQFNKSELINLR